MKVRGQKFAREIWPDKAAAIITTLKSCGNTYEDIDNALEACNALLGGSGVEPIRDRNHHSYYQDIGLLYVNLGDTYTPTVIFDTYEDRFEIMAWGDMVENNPSRFWD